MRVIISDCSDPHVVMSYGQWHGRMDEDLIAETTELQTNSLLKRLPDGLLKRLPGALYSVRSNKGDDDDVNACLP